jgi:LPXTG-motif cell wall-anchored protein
MLRSLFARAVLAVIAATALVTLVTIITPEFAAADPVTDPVTEATDCHDAALARQRTEVDADMTVPRFDPALGTLLEVSVPDQAVHLDTDALFENTAQTAVTFAEHMDYQVTFASPGGLASPAPLLGTIERVPIQTVAAFDGTLDFAGPSAVAQPSTAQDAAAAPVASTDPGVLGAFTGPGTLAFHVSTVIGETFMGGGGNIEAQIHTFASASVRVCYRFAPPVSPPTTTPTTTPVTTPPTTPPTSPPRVLGAVATRSRPTLPRTGSGSAVLGIVGAAAVGIGALLASRGRRSRPSLDG